MKLYNRNIDEGINYSYLDLDLQHIHQKFLYHQALRLHFEYHAVLFRLIM